MRLPAVLLLALALGCGSGQPTPPASVSPASGPAAEARVTPGEGGTAGAADGASVAVPPGAVEREVRIAVAPDPGDVPATPGVRVVGRVWAFTVDGKEHFTFAKPVRVAVPADPSLVDVTLSVWQEGEWQAVPGARREGARLVADVGHFSKYAATTKEPVESLLDDARRRFLGNEHWYGHVRIVIRGSGRKADPQGERSWSVSRDLDLRFRLTVSREEIAALAVAEEMAKRAPVKLPAGALDSVAKLRNARHWNSPVMNRGPEDEDQVRLSVADVSEESGEEPQEGGGGPKFTKRWSLEGSDDRATAAHHTLEIDVAKGTWSLQVDDKIDMLDLTEVSTRSGESPKRARARRHAAGVSLTFKDQKLPAGGSILGGARALAKQDLGEVRSFGYGRISGTMTWVLSPVPLDEAELVLAPEGYDEWLPRGGKDEQTKGNSIRVKALLQAPGGGATKRRLKDLVVHIDDVSREPGVCLNSPAGGGSATPDLRFADVAGATIDKEGTRLRKEDGEFAELAFEVESCDWGAYGAIVARGTCTDGCPVWATLAGDPSVSRVLLPKRDPESKVGDAWKARMGAESAADADDKDKQKGNRNDGDGLTVYEEYRGLVAKGKHTRDDPSKPLSPGTKDLVVENTIKNVPAVIAGLQLLEKASGIRVIEVEPGELPESRQVNVNAGRITAGAQHGLRLTDEPGKGVGAAEGARVGRFDPDPTVSPKGFPKVMVDIPGLMSDHKKLVRVCASEGARVPNTAEESIANTVAHELAHGLGVRHHGGNQDRTPYPEVTVQMKDWKVYDRQGRELRDRPFPIDGGVGEPYNASSGDVNCIMCYNGIYNWSYDDSARTFYAVPFAAPGKAFCTSGKATGTNAPYTLPGGAKSPGLFRDSRKGNCLAQMRVRDP